jgi:hypothetical protein
VFIQNANIKIYRTVLFYMGVRQQHKRRVFENRVLMKILGPERVKVTGARGNCIMRTFKICTA